MTRGKSAWRRNQGASIRLELANACWLQTSFESACQAEDLRK